MLWAIAASVLSAGTVTFQQGVSPSAAYQVPDTRLWDGLNMPWEPDTNYSALGAVHVGGVRGAYAREQAALLRFELSSIPPSETVVSARLTVYVQNASPLPVPIWVVTRPWAVGTVTWNFPWASPGAKGASDRAATSLGSFLAPDAGLFTSALSPLTVQSWVSDAGGNFGLLLAQPTLPDAVELHSSQWPAVNQRPQLQVTTNVTTYTFRQGATGYLGATDTTIANAADPANVSWDRSGLQLAGGPDAGAPADQPHSGALLKFEVSAVPPWARVEAVRLVLYTETVTPQPYPVNEMLTDWTENATWFTSDGGARWQTEGAQGALDRSGVVLGTVAADGGGYLAQFNDAGVVAVQCWVSNPALNHGLVMSEYSRTGSTYVFESESVLAFQRPRLEVSYTEGQLLALPDLVQRLSFQGAPITGPPLDVELSCGGGVQVQWPDGGVGSAGTLQIPAGQSTVALATRTDGGAGFIFFDAGSLWQGTALAFSAVDGGAPDAGSPDAAVPDAGADLDAGVAADAGAPGDGGWSSGRPLDVGCGCVGSPGAVLAVLAVLVARRRLRLRWR